MKLKLIINALEAPDDYKLLRTTISTVASLRKTAILRFTEEKLVIISSPQIAANASNNNAVLTGDSGQLWCSIPRDVFSFYQVVSTREQNTITLEYSCDSFLSVLKRYDRAMNQGSISDMSIKLQAMPEWNPPNESATSNGTARPKQGFVCALGISFEEIVHTNNAAVGNEPNDIDDGLGMIAKSTVMGNNRLILHSFKIPVKLLVRSQDARIKEPTINSEQLIMFKLPPTSSELGGSFHNFMKRIERYSNLHDIKLSAIKKNQRNINDADAIKFKMIVDELDWYLEICWNGPLDPIFPHDPESEKLNQGETAQNSHPIYAEHDTFESAPSEPLPSRSYAEEEYYPSRIEDSETSCTTNNSTMREESATENGRGAQLADVSTMVELAEQESSSTYEVKIRSKDWKVCSKLYVAFQEVSLLVSHNDSCVFHCSLDRGSIDDSNGDEIDREKGHIIYYIARSKAL
ncbi:hypothetical protein KAFR_0A04850 [Kazachstania africana CBS 2517]|uniref:Checkpoint protein n=1 Tax=Kazachstania africana (strain ATCC 22294 / BCRC 22015 / CBS 2517 / CECT 1963 / NBRC 1671 / NRRL Y-8276) TaxID=1071382 RepID=H2ANH1_KAZAF|nr:hypothetical protein KAFR_0A04850 [Kazachstania africana CBS 2517]CCF55921.1 hypothetical protein KAFR_0A04850 [Kazachstania africana CBS 2517]